MLKRAAALLRSERHPPRSFADSSLTHLFAFPFPFSRLQLCRPKGSEVRLLNDPPSHYQIKLINEQTSSLQSRHYSQDPPSQDQYQARVRVRWPRPDARQASGGQARRADHRVHQGTSFRLDLSIDSQFLQHLIYLPDARLILQKPVVKFIKKYMYEGELPADDDDDVPVEKKPVKKRAKKNPVDAEAGGENVPVDAA